MRDMLGNIAELANSNVFMVRDHVLLPGSSFLEKDGTFTNAERRISRVRKVMPRVPAMRIGEATIELSKRLGYDMDYTHPSQIMDEIAAPDADFPRRQL